MQNPTPPLRVLVIDDSAVYRKIVREVLASAPGIEVVGTAANGVVGLAQIRALKPDAVTLDFEMPQLDGIGVLRRLAGDPSAPAAIMVSAFTTSGAAATTTALQEGAFDFILKPATKSLSESVSQLSRDLLPKLEACRAHRAIRRPLCRAKPAPPPPRPAPPRRAAVPGRANPLRLKPEVVCVAVSTGGPKALTQLLPRLPRTFPCPIVMVQHMPPMFTASLAADLDRRCQLEVIEGATGMQPRAGQIVIAPGGKQMRLANADGGLRIEITNDPPERNCKPAADYLFRSAAATLPGKAVGVVLTGMGDDGTEGARAIKDTGGVILAQDEASCVVYGMPKSVIDNGLADFVEPLGGMATRMISAVQRGALV
ncbi:MAG: chemotaxis-specific protein-glutamate methyltransferase CheB [Planctomycetota bacterium]